MLRSPISPVPLGYREPALCHILYFKRQVSIELNNDTVLEGSFVVPFEGRNFNFFFFFFNMTNEPSGYGCKAKDHLRADCPNILKEVFAHRGPEPPKEDGSVNPDICKRVPAPRCLEKSKED